MKKCFYVQDERFVIDGKVKQIALAVVFENGIVVDYDKLPLENKEFDIDKTNEIWEEEEKLPLDLCEFTHDGKLTWSGNNYELETFER